MMQQHTRAFFTPEQFASERPRRMEATRGRFLVASCDSGSHLAGRVVGRYRELLAEEGSEAEVLYLEGIDDRFSDSETCVHLDRHVGGYDAFLLQALLDPTCERAVDQNYMALLIAARAFREHGARHVTAILPYLAYARQDEPARFKREPTTAKLMADLSAEAGVDRLITWHPHSRHIRGFYDRMAVDILEPLPLFVEEFRRFKGRDDVIVVAPDAGASKYVTYFARALDLKSAIASKYRPQPEKASITEIIGDFGAKRVALVLDDMISSGGTVYALVRRLVEEKGIDRVHIGVSHNLCMEAAYDRLSALYADYGLQELVTTNSVPQTEAFQALPFISIRCLSDTLARVINRIHYNRSVSELFEPAGVGR